MRNLLLRVAGLSLASQAFAGPDDATPSPDPAATPEATSPAPTPQATPGDTTSEATPVPDASATPESTAVPAASPTPESTAVPSPQPTVTEMDPKELPTPVPIATPAPSPTPRPLGLGAPVLFRGECTPGGGPSGCRIVAAGVVTGDALGPLPCDGKLEGETRRKIAERYFHEGTPLDLYVRGAPTGTFLVADTDEPPRGCGNRARG